MTASLADTNEQPGAATTTPEDAITEEAANPAEAQDAEATDSLDALPDWARNEIKTLRREAGNYRTQLKSVREAQVQTEEQFNALREELTRKEKDLTRERIGEQFGIPAKLRARLSGDTEEELLEDAKAVAELLKPAAPTPQPIDTPSPSGGLDSSSDPEPSPEELAAQARTQRW